MIRIISVLHLFSALLMPNIVCVDISDNYL